jgi:hypothetical protein
MAKIWVLLQKQQGGLSKLPKKTFSGLRNMVLKLSHG